MLRNVYVDIVIIGNSPEINRLLKPLSNFKDFSINNYLKIFN